MTESFPISLFLASTSQNSKAKSEKNICMRARELAVKLERDLRRVKSLKSVYIVDEQTSNKDVVEFTRAVMVNGGHEIKLKNGFEGNVLEMESLFASLRQYKEDVSK